MYAVLGEDRSDTDTLQVIIRRLANNQRVAVRPKSYGSCGELVRKAERDLRTLANLNCRRFVICYDADGFDPKPRFEQMSAVVRRSGVSDCCVLIPVQEIEAWVLGDVEAVTKVFKGWRPTPKPLMNPESIESPKEYLVRLSRGANQKPRYDHINDNSRVAEYLNLTLVEQRCPSFKPLADFVRKGETKSLP